VTTAIKLEGAVIAMEFDISLNEGIVGTSLGFVFYINLQEN
jgi:hypothetical protein